MLPETGDAGVPVKGWFSSPLSFFVASLLFFPSLKDSQVQGVRTLTYNGVVFYCFT